ncbi:hypothetical protein [Pseudomaricurvus sp. HS19]|uniref:hypothetical protein n=1 Tax=Pseudomaricurvus sp. HS19 TaxID=2692626 RepID=UPI00137094E2|nr:hypothetical protein [Pseudomaricurvus sp. HS19]MYM62110.1 hypothetical protein [Pseudomaricurvus sp. HS19]
MLFGFRRKSRPAFGVAMVASLAFIALAIWGWNVPVDQILSILLACLLLIVGLVLVSAALIVGLKLLRRLLRKPPER